jgi:hypothetical protein
LALGDVFCAKSDTTVSAVMRSLEMVIKDDCWRHWRDYEGRQFTWHAADFRWFLTSRRPEGCETPVDIVGRMRGCSEARLPGGHSRN